jgi:hypothetical protein
MPAGLSRLNALAWHIWRLLDLHGRDIDTMAGNPLPLRLTAIDGECGRYEDAQGLRWRVLLIDEQALTYRRQK